MSLQARSTKVRRGVAVMEFTLSLLFLIPLLLGVLIFGFKLIRSLEMTQVTRDLGAMYLRGVDFRNAGAQQTAQNLAQDYNLTAGTSVVILSRVKLITSADCTAANAVPPLVAGSACVNQGKFVFTEQLIVGNPTAGSSGFGTPPVQPALSTITKLVVWAGEFAYVAEMVNLTPDLNIPGLSGGPQVYARAIF